MKTIIVATVLAVSCSITPLAQAIQDPHRGIIQNNDGSFNYQGHLEFEGVPANGDFFFEVHLFNSINNEIDPLYSELGPITVTDGLFEMDIQMGDNQADADTFWDRYGHIAKSMRIMVSQVEGGPYTTLSPDVQLGSSPHALWSQYTSAIQFPYTDTHTNLFADPETMISLHNEFGGMVMDLTVGAESNIPTLRVQGSALSDNAVLTGPYGGAVQINSTDELVGLLGVSDGFPLLGYHVSESAGNRAAVLGEVGFSANPEIIAVWALNSASGNRAALGTGQYAGDFIGDVIARSDLRVQGEPTRDYANNSPSPIGPLAYGSVSSSGSLNSGTANVSSSWDASSSTYIISVTGESLSFQNHTVSITVVDLAEPRIATYNAIGGNLLVKIWDINSGNVAVQDNFSIVIHDPTATTINRMAAPNGMDEDKYTERTGVQLIQTQPRNEPVVPFENYGSGTSGD